MRHIMHIKSLKYRCSFCIIYKQKVWKIAKVSKYIFEKLSSSTGGQQLDSTPHSVETPNQLLNAHHTDNISEAGYIFLMKKVTLFSLVHPQLILC